MDKDKCYYSRQLALDQAQKFHSHRLGVDSSRISSQTIVDTAEKFYNFLTKSDEVKEIQNNG